MLVELFEIVSRSFLFNLVVIASIILFIRNMIRYLNDGELFIYSLFHSMAISVGVIIAAYIVALIIYLVLSFWLLAIIVIAIVVFLIFELI